MIKLSSNWALKKTLKKNPSLEFSLFVVVGVFPVLDLGKLLGQEIDDRFGAEVGRFHKAVNRLQVDVSVLILQIVL